MSRTVKDIFYDVIIPATIAALIIFGLFLLAAEDVYVVNENSNKYEVICKHPEGNILKHTVDQNNWNNLHNSRNSIWRFTDIAGNTIKISGPCYTDNKEKK